MTSKSIELRDLLRRRAVVAAQKPPSTGLLFKSYETFVLAYGRAYESAPLDDRERAHVKQMLREHLTWWQRGFQYKHCFRNSQELMMFDATGKVVYVEGYVWAYGDRLPPVHHGWLSLHGKVIDLTVPTRAIAGAPKLPAQPPQLHGEFEGRAYFGVPFLRSYLQEEAKKEICWGSLLNDEPGGYPLLVKGGDGSVRGARRLGGGHILRGRAT